MLSKVASTASEYALLPLSYLNAANGGIVLIQGAIKQTEGKLAKEKTNSTKESMLNVIAEIRLNRQGQTLEALTAYLLSRDGAAANELLELEGMENENPLAIQLS